MNFKPHTNCRVCDSTKLIKYLDLGMMPLANNLANTFEDAIAAERYPLQVMFCEDCGLSQLSAVVDPKVLFSNYVYRSSINKDYLDHCNKMAVDLKEKHGLTKDSFHIDIAGNDGALLSEFKKVIGHRVLNVDPAQNMAAINDAQHIRFINDFWSVKRAETLNGFGKADLITATNVFAHVDNVKDFLQGCYIALKETGVLVLEFPYLIDFIQKGEWDTVYHEHLSYFSISPLFELARKTGFYLYDVQPQDIHGGTVRVTLGKATGTVKGLNRVENYLEVEFVGGYLEPDEYAKYQTDVNIAARAFEQGMLSINYPTERIAAFAASAKGNTLLNYCGNHSKIDFIVDETPEKIGKYAPGNGKPIVSMFDLIRLQPDYLIILSWNFKESIIAKCKAAGYKGKFVIPIPVWQEVE